ncbi:outer membrane protein assembly factor BamB family protein [Halorussus halophilus]|uniref:outer membrane protein assembly factor BamB family protein n=1 Tax=Halorussus halophilus TaxID=2650975 RepID=UPI0013010A92|nr:PQQ-binding-like beta-propeller repeat protein [Halorussus halophilus]
MTIDWHKDRFDLGNSGHAPTSGPDGSPTCRWQCDVGYSVPGTPAVVGDSVYVATMYPTDSKPNVLGVNRHTGEITMETASDDPFGETRGSVCVADGIVYVSVLDDPPVTRGYDAKTGERVREYDVQPPIHSDKSPFIADGAVYSAVDFALGAFDARSEEALWTHNPEAEIYGTPAMSDGTLYAGGVKTVGESVESGDDDFPYAEQVASRLQAIDAATGRVEWERNILPKPETPAVVDGTCYVCGQQPYRRYATFDVPADIKDAIRKERSDGGIPEYGVVQAVATDDGSERWRRKLSEPVRTPPAVTRERVIVGTDAGTILGLDAKTGTVVWRFQPDKAERVRTAPAIASGVAYVGSGQTLYALDIRSGTVQWQYDMDAVIGSSPAVVDGTVYVVGADNMLRAIE